MPKGCVFESLAVIGYYKYHKFAHKLFENKNELKISRQCQKVPFAWLTIFSGRSDQECTFIWKPDFFDSLKQEGMDGQKWKWTFPSKSLQFYTQLSCIERMVLENQLY